MERRALTAGEVAQYIRRPDEPEVAAIARFRNWEKTGIIKAIGDSNPGTGRRKQYSPDTVLRAVLLQTLVDTFGSSAVSLSELINDFTEILLSAGFLKESEVVVLSRPRGARRFNIRRMKASKLATHITSSSVDIHVVIDVKRLFDRIDHDWKTKFQYLPKIAVKFLRLQQTAHPAALPAADPAVEDARFRQHPFNQEAENVEDAYRAKQQKKKRPKSKDR